jgi:hypothetical protein
MDLTRIKKLTENIRKQNGGRRPVPQEMHKALKKTAKDLIYSWLMTPGSKQAFLADLAKPGYEPTLFELYVLREMMGIDE